MRHKIEKEKVKNEQRNPGKLDYKPQDEKLILITNLSQKLKQFHLNTKAILD